MEESLREEIEGKRRKGGEGGNEGLRRKRRRGVEDVLSRVSGPWSMIYFRKSLNLLVIGRDPLGRHSLLWNVDDSHQWTGPLIVASAVPEGTYSEVPADRMFAINFSRSPTIESLSSRRGYRIDRRIPAAEEGAAVLLIAIHQCCL